MIPAKRLAEIRSVLEHDDEGYEGPSRRELLELVTAYEAARELAPAERLAMRREPTASEYNQWRTARLRLLALFPEPTK